MKAIICNEYGPPEKLSLQTMADPAPGDKEVLIRVEACGINFPDLLLIQRLYQFQPPLPFSPGGEVAGTIVATGQAANRFQPGDRVMAVTGWGGFAELVSVAEHQVIALPADIDFITAAAATYQYGTALYALKNLAILQPGEILLVLGAGSGVGLAAVELGRLMGANVIAAASSERKLNACLEKGAHHVINTAEKSKTADLAAAIPGGKVDVIFDPVGGQLALQSFRLMAWKGRYLIVGFAAGDIPNLPFNLPLLKGCSVQGVFWGSFLQQEPKAHQANMQMIFDWLTQKKIQPLIHQTYALEEAPLALQDLKNRKVIGKAVINLQQQPSAHPPVANKPGEVQPAQEKSNHAARITQLGDITALLGKELGPGEWFTVTAPMIQQFAKLSGDEQWIHVDIERAAKEMPGGKTIAHGFFTLSLATRMLYQLIDITAIEKMFNYGTNKVRFITPVQAGSRIRMRATLSRTEPGKQGGTLLFIACTIEVENAEKPACVAELVSLIFA
ncbi:MAG: zinc-binding dehydrogenase [Bacteroidota bacterium]